ncbi:MAG: hypothetical protein AAFU60_18550, partial [Bacteroidota bacterium]
TVFGPVFNVSLTKGLVVERLTVAELMVYRYGLRLYSHSLRDWSLWRFFSFFWGPDAILIGIGTYGLSWRAFRRALRTHRWSIVPSAHWLWLRFNSTPLLF